MKRTFFRKIKKTFIGLLCAMTIISHSALSTAAEAPYGYDEYGDPIVTATPVPESDTAVTSTAESHTEYYDQAADTDSIEGWPEGPKIEAESAILVDMVSGAVLYSKNADKQEYPASITKIMTALLACEHLNAEDTFTMSETAAHGISVSDSSSIYAETGEQFTVEQAMMAIMLQSANEMTLQVAELTSGNVKKFVELMNQKARQLGCTGTHFNNTSGLPDTMHYTTAADMAKIARAAWYNATFRKYVTTVSYNIPPTNKFSETRYLINHHKMMQGLAYAYDGVLGGKTGYTDDAGNTLVTFAKNDNTYLVSVVLKSVNGAYSDTKALLDYGFNNFTRAAVQNQKTEYFSTALTAEKYILNNYDHFTWFTLERATAVTLPNGVDQSALQTSLSFSKNTIGLPLMNAVYSYNGHSVGSARYKQQSLLTGWLASSEENTE